MALSSDTEGIIMQAAILRKIGNPFCSDRNNHYQMTDSYIGKALKTNELLEAGWIQSACPRCKMMVMWNPPVYLKKKDDIVRISTTTGFDQYQEQSKVTAIYPEAGSGSFGALAYIALGLSGEAGEVAGKIKKVYRDDAGVLSESKRLDILDELGDVIWYLSQLCTELDVNFSDVADHNILKLKSRQQRGVLGGSGDKR